MKIESHFYPIWHFHPESEIMLLKKRAILETKIGEIVTKEGMDRIVGLLSLRNYMANQCN